MKKLISFVLLLVLCLGTFSSCFEKPEDASTPPPSNGGAAGGGSSVTTDQNGGNTENGIVDVTVPQPEVASTEFLLAYEWGALSLSRSADGRLLSISCVEGCPIPDFAQTPIAEERLRILYGLDGKPMGVAVWHQDSDEGEKIAPLVAKENGRVFEGFAWYDTAGGLVRLEYAEDGSLSRLMDRSMTGVYYCFGADGRLAVLQDVDSPYRTTFSYGENTVTATDRYAYETDSVLLEYGVGGLPHKATILCNGEEEGSIVWSYENGTDRCVSLSAYEDGSLDSEITFAYDENGRLSQIGGGSDYSRKYKYDAEGLLIQKDQTRGDWSERYQYEYAPNGALSKRIYTDFSYGEKSVTVYERDAGGYLIEESYSRYNLADVLLEQGVYKYRYDADMRLFEYEVRKFDEDGVLSYTRLVAYTYAADGQRIKKVDTTNYYDDGSVISSDISTRTYTFDAYGRELKQVVVYDTASYVYEHEYDESGLLIRYRFYSYNENGTLTSKSITTYTYDQDGNLVSKETIE